MNKTLSFLVLLGLLGMASAFGQVVSFAFILSENDTVQPAWISIGAGDPSRFQHANGSYLVFLSDNQGAVLDQMGFDTDFYMSEPPRKVDQIPISGRLRYYSQTRFLVMSHNSREIYRYEFPNGTCNHDGRCAFDEHVISCPSDCNVTSDHICTPFQDHVCDYDCGRLDPDCPSHAAMTLDTMPPICLGAFALAALLIVSGVIWFFFGRQKPNLPDAAKGKTHKRAKR